MPTSVLEMSDTRIILVRHGQSQGNVAAERAAAEHLAKIDVPARDADVELSDLGIEQARAMGQWLAKLPDDQRPDLLWTSPFRRARQTAEEATGVAGMDLPTHVDERLRDRDMGITDMLTSDGIQAKYPEETERRAWLGKFYYRPPGGESWADVALRVRGVLTDVATLAEGKTVLVTAHDVVNLLFCYVAENMDEAQVLDRSKNNGLKNAAICRLHRDPESPTGWTVDDYNIDEHLVAAGITVTDQPGASDEVGPSTGSDRPQDAPDPAALDDGANESSR